LDQGPGIPDYALTRVFERFYSLPRPEGGSRSSGLGLCFVAEVAALHGGRATLENVRDGGAIATLELPEAGLHRPPTPPPSAPHAPARGCAHPKARKGPAMRFAFKAVVVFF